MAKSELNGIASELDRLLNFYSSTLVELFNFEFGIDVHELVVMFNQTMLANN